MEVSCPAGQITRDYRSTEEGRGGQFLFSQACCQAYPLRSQCVRGQGPRSISIQAEERLQQQARAHNQTEAGRQSLRERVVVEHRIARLVGLGIRQSRYFGKKKPRWQVVMAAVSGEPEFGGRVLPAAGSEPRRRHRCPGPGAAHSGFSGGPFDLLGPISSPERQPRLRRSVRRRVMNARRTTNHLVARTYLSTETPVFGWISRKSNEAGFAPVFARFARWKHRANLWRTENLQIDFALAGAPPRFWLKEPPAAFRSVSAAETGDTCAAPRA